MIIKKPHTWLELDAAAFNSNAQCYKSLIGNTGTLAAVVKSNAYGHGMQEVGALCQQNNNIDWLCTSSLSEALTLRAANIAKPILVMGIIDDNPELAIAHDIDVVLFDIEAAYELNALGKLLHKKVNIHIKIDTGLTRFGFYPNQTLPIIKEIAQMAWVNMRGIMTHCAESYNPDQSFTLQQLETFNQLINQIEDAGIDIPLKHAFNSAATSTFMHLFPKLNFFRVGAGLYGLWHFKDSWHDMQANHGINLKPVLTWKTQVMHIKHAPTGAYVSYDRTYQTTKPTTIAILPMGYYENYDRRLSNKGIVLIKSDFYAPVIGRVCMNATIIEIPEGKTVNVGDEVTLLGDYDQIRAHDLTNAMASYNAREITTRLNTCIERIVTNQAAVAITDKKEHKQINL